MTKSGTKSGIIVASVLTALYAQAADAASAKRAAFGTLPDGTAIEAVTLAGSNGVSARIMTLGATLQSFNAPDRNGKIADITLGYDDAASYVAAPNFWGQTIGRYANRIAGGRFRLDGKAYRLPLNHRTRMQFYSGSILDGTPVGKAGHVSRMGDGLALEPRTFPDRPNQPAFGSVRVEPGESYHHRMVYRVSTTR